MKKAGSLADAVFSSNDQVGLQTGAAGMPPTPEMGMISNVGDAVQLAKSASTIAEPGPAPNSAWGNALISGGKLALSMFGEMVMPGQGATMVGTGLDQAKAAGDMMLPNGTAGAVGDVFNQLTGLGGGPEPAAAPAAAAPAPAASPAAVPGPAPVVPTASGPVPVPVPSAPPRAFPSSPLATDDDVRERLSR